MTNAQKLTEIVALILDKGSEDGAMHKQWVLDQVLRIALESKYDAVIEEFYDGEWEEGTPV